MEIKIAEFNKFNFNYIQRKILNAIFRRYLILFKLNGHIIWILIQDSDTRFCIGV